MLLKVINECILNKIQVVKRLKSKANKVIMSESMNMSFNASIAVTELLMKTLENVSKELASRCVRECGAKYGFDSEEAIRSLGLENLSLIRKAMAKKSGPTAKKEKTVRAPKEKKPSIPLPFTATSVSAVNCQGLAFNRGLFTQCQRKHMENGDFCSACQAEADQNASGCPDCGTVSQRLATGLYDFKDSKGRSPVRYTKLLEKLKVSPESAMTEAGKFNVEIDEEHFTIVQNVKAKEASSPRGRPKKATTIVEAENVEDLFAELAAEGEEMGEELEEKPARSSKKPKLTEQEKEARKAEIENERILKKQEREAKLALEKAEREAKRAAEAEQRKAEREQKLALEKAEREQKIAEEKAQREAKRAAEAEQKKKEKEAAKATKSTKSTKKESNDANKDKSSVKATNTAATDAATAPAATAPAAAAPAKVSVTRIQIDGVSYLKSAANILYNPQTKEEVGLYDPATKTMKPLPEEEEEEEEEDYESDDE